MIGTYYRLSLADEDVGADKAESNSIQGQRGLVEGYIMARPELATESRQEYVDDGYSGTSTSRPAFQRLIQDAQDGKVKTIIVKDFSRFARDYIEAGDYMERIFPLLGVRFISVNDGYDSGIQIGNDVRGLEVAIKNIINASYSRDLSAKIAAADHVMQKKGMYLGGYRPFGFLPDLNDCHKLILDPVASRYVRLIFELALQGNRTGTIAKILNRSNKKSVCGYAKGAAEMKKLNIPVGISDFEKIRNGGFYYIDKSGLITEILDEKAEVILITRPRRFGKTLGMSMLESFFDIRKDSKELFDGLEIAEHQVLCDEWMNQYPTVFISFRQVDGLDFTGAYDMLTMVIADLYNKHLYLLDSKSATEFQKTAFEHLAHGNGSIKEVKSSLMLLTTMMQSYYAKPVILLIDEYDVPVVKANNNGYYNEMLDVMKGLMQALKDNQALQFAVVTGCLKIAKESIFTGTNNFVSDTITNSRLNEYFGFVQSEVDLLLKDADLTTQAESIKKWYDGYHFGAFDVYCPWDVMNYLLELQRNPKAKPINKSSTEMQRASAISTRVAMLGCSVPFSILARNSRLRLILEAKASWVILPHCILK